MKNERTKMIVAFSIIGVLVIAAYAYHEANDDPNRVTEKWLRKNPNYWKEGLEFYEKFDYEGLDYNTAYCKLHSGDWIEIRVEKGFLDTWHVRHVEEVSFEELPEWVYTHINKEPKVLEEWEERHRDRVEKMVTYDEYIREGTLYYIKLKNNMWLILKLNKDSFGNWCIEEKEIGKDPKEIAENLHTWYEEGEITIAEIEKFLEILAGDGADTVPIRDLLKEKGVPLDNEEK